MRTPVVVVTGVDPQAVDAATVSLVWDLPKAVAVRHTIDPVPQVLTRVVSDAHGVVEREQIDLEHACTSCALREDVVPTLERVGRDARWSTVVLALPTGTEADQVAHLLTTDRRLARHLRLSSLVAVMGGPGLVDDLLDDALLAERGWHTGPDDERGIGETACAQVEQADVVVVTEGADGTAHDLVRALARPDAAVVDGVANLDGRALATGRHERLRALGWSASDAEREVPPLARTSGAWRLLLTSPRPFHPDRLLDRIEQLGAGRHRSRGCFWVPTRPGAVLEWSGAGGQLSIGTRGTWGRRTPATRLLLTGVGEPPAHLAQAFEDLLLRHEEALLAPRDWQVLEDGLEPWLGDVRDVA